MSSTTTTSSTAYGGHPSALLPPPPIPSGYLTNLGLGYAIALALGFLVLFSAVLLTSYICCRSSSRRRPQDPNASDDGVYVPRVIFVAEDDNDSSQNGAGVGLDQSVINSYPKFTFSKTHGNETVCAICLCDFKDAEMLRMMPDCRHGFHVTCIDAWLKLNGSCPVCRNSPLPTPLSTPLAEAVPLSQYSDGRRR